MEKEQIISPENRLKVAQENVQNPFRFETFAEKIGVKMAIESRPAEGEYVTGDFYRTIQMRDGRISIFIGNIEGHGRKAAEATLELHNFMETPAFQQSCTEGVQASDMLKYIDQHKPVSELFLTLAHVLLDPKTGQLEYANAGMPYLYIRRENGEVVELHSSGFYVGSGYSEHNSGTVFAKLSPGDTAIFACDGVLEAASRKGGKMKESFEELLREAGNTAIPPKELARRIISELASPRKDDATILIFQLQNR